MLRIQVLTYVLTQYGMRSPPRHAKGDLAGRRFAYPWGDCLWFKQTSRAYRGPVTTGCQIAEV
jgi:hypothetical protein